MGNPRMTEGKSGTAFVSPDRKRRRTFQERMDAFPAAIARTEEFRGRLKLAEGDVYRCADMMAEAIAMDREARGLSPVGNDGRSVFEFERLQACYCLDDSRAAYLRARGSNQPIDDR